MSVVSVVCCQVEVSATSRSLVQRSPTDCEHLMNEEAMARFGPQHYKNIYIYNQFRLDCSVTQLHSLQCIVLTNFILYFLTDVQEVLLTLLSTTTFRCVSEFFHKVTPADSNLLWWTISSLESIIRRMAFRSRAQVVQ